MPDAPTPTEVAEAPAVEAVETVATEVPDTSPKGEKLLAIIGYIGFLCVLPLAIKPKSEFCQHHGKQALLMAILFIIGSAVMINLGTLFQSLMMLRLGILIRAAYVVFAIMGILGASAGKKLSLPFFGAASKKTLQW